MCGRNNDYNKRQQRCVLLLFVCVCVHVSAFVYFRLRSDANYNKVGNRFGINAVYKQKNALTTLSLNVREFNNWPTQRNGCLRCRRQNNNNECTNNMRNKQLESAILLCKWIAIIATQNACGWSLVSRSREEEEDDSYDDDEKLRRYTYSIALPPWLSSSTSSSSLRQQRRQYTLLRFKIYLVYTHMHVSYCAVVVAAASIVFLVLVCVGFHDARTFISLSFCFWLSLVWKLAYFLIRPKKQ